MSGDTLKAGLQEIGWQTWLGLWWGHMWRYFWRGMVLLLVTAVTFMGAIMLFKVLGLESAKIFFVLLLAMIVMFLWWCFKNYIYALDAMMKPGISFGGYQLRFLKNSGEDTVAERLSAMRWLSWGMIWRNFVWGIPVMIADVLYTDFAIPKLLPPEPSQLEHTFYYYPFWIAVFMLHAYIWIRVLKSRTGKDIKGYYLCLISATTAPAAVTAEPVNQSQWGGKT